MLDKKFRKRLKEMYGKTIKMVNEMKKIKNLK